MRTHNFSFGGEIAFWQKRVPIWSCVAKYIDCLCVNGPHHAKPCLQAFADSEDPDQTASVQSDLGLHCPLTESFDTIEWINEEQLLGWDFAHVRDDSQSMHFAHVWRHLFAWCLPYNPIYISCYQLIGDFCFCNNRMFIFYLEHYWPYFSKTNLHEVMYIFFFVIHGQGWMWECYMLWHADVNIYKQFAFERMLIWIWKKKKKKMLSRSGFSDQILGLKIWF